MLGEGEGEVLYIVPTFQGHELWPWTPKGLGFNKRELQQEVRWELCAIASNGLIQSPGRHVANGVFRPKEQVDLPEASEVEFEPRAVKPVGDLEASLVAAYAVLSERYASGATDLAARHDEHKP